MLNRNFGKYFVFACLMLTLCAIGDRQAVAQGTEDSVISTGPSAAELKDLTDTVLMDFVKYKTIQYTDSLFFNVLKIENRTNSRIEGRVKINVPEGWKLVNSSEVPVNIVPGGKRYIPVRVIMARSSKGGVAYIISALLKSSKPFQMNGRKSMTLLSSCYVSAPKITRWKMYSREKVIYMSPQKDFETFELHFENTGNSEELVKVEFEIGSSVKMIGAAGNTYIAMIKLPANKDTVVYYQVMSVLDDEDISIYNWKESSIRIKASAGGKSMMLNMWFKYLKSYYNNGQDRGNTPLTVELVASNLLSNFKPNLSLNAYGSLLLANDQSLGYFLMNPDITYYRGIKGSDYTRNLWQRSRFRVDYRNHRNLHIAVGDIGAGMAAGVYGRGIQGKYYLGNNTFEAAVVRSLFYPVTGAVLNHTIKLNTSIVNRLSTGLTYINDTFNKINTTATALGVSGSFLKSHVVSARFGFASNNHFYNDSTFALSDSTFVQTDDPNSVLTGFDYDLLYSGKVNRFQIKLTNRYGSDNSAGPYRGRFELASNVYYPISSKYSATFIYSKYDYSPVRYVQGVKFKESRFVRDSYQLQLSGKFNRKTFYSMGPNVEYLSHSRFDPISGTIIPLTTVSPRVLARMTFRDDKQNTIIPYVSMGYTQALDQPDSAFGKSLTYFERFSRPYYNAKVGLNVRRKVWGVNAYYFFGPYNIATQYGYVYGGTFNKSIRILPYFEKWISNKKIKLASYNSYNFDAVTNAERISLHIRAEFYLKKGWMLHVNNNISLSSRYNDEFGRQSNRAYFFDFGLRKRFDIPQPRVKYYDLKVVCFEDLNGDRVMDGNEGGLDYVLIKIDRDLEADSIALGRFVYIELATDPVGEINYYKIPEGTYKMEFLPLGNIGDLYNVNGPLQKFKVVANTTIYVPFVKSNKVVGKIIFERDEYSSEGVIKLGDIRISARDSLGNTYACLTDKKGHFTLFVPQTGRSVVTINNVFSDHFELEQDKFLVDFNGFKEFEVVFKFVEHTRGININGGSGSQNGGVFDGRTINGGDPDGGGNQTGAPGGAGSGSEAPGGDGNETGAPGGAGNESGTPGGSGSPDGSTNNSTDPASGDSAGTSGSSIGTGADVSLRDPSDQIAIDLPNKSISWEETEYYIVASAFTGETEARGFIDQLERQDNALIVRSKDNLQYLVIFSYRTEDEAREDLEDRQSVAPAAWITKKE